jgi:raffinose/stachyose/melibiose transport system substrate-binding protein
MFRARTTLALAAVLLTLAATATASAASGPKAHTSQSASLTAITVVPDRKALDSLIASYTRRTPGVSINPTYVSTSVTIFSLLSTQAAGGNPPDIIQVAAGNAAPGATQPLVKAKRLLDLSKESWVKTVPSGLKALMSYKGKIYAYPYTAFLFGTVFNRTIFKKAGVKVPKTSADLVKACRTIRSKTGVTPITLALAQPATAFAQVWQLAAAFVYATDPKWDAKRAAKKTTFAKSKEWKSVFSYLSQLRAADCFSPGATGTTTPAATIDIQTGKTAMFPFVSQVMTVMRTNGAANGQDLGFMTLPAAKAKNTRSSVSTSGFGVTSTKNVAAAKRFIAYLATPANNSGFNKISGGLSINALVKGKLPIGYEESAKIVKRGLLPFSFAQWPNPNMGNYLGAQMAPWFNGSKSTADILKALDYLWDNPTAATAP